MRDCPACRVPLHGYEEVCPSCGTKQYPSKSSRGPYGTGFKPEEPKVNWTPFILVFVGVAIFLVVAMQGTWIGQMMRGEHKTPEDPIAQMSTFDARTMVETELNKNLDAVGAKNTKMEWKAGGAAAEGGAAPVDGRNIDGPVEVAIHTTLPSKDVRKSVVDPIKPYMEKAKIHTLTMTDSASKATWTYNVQATTSVPEPDAGLGGE